MPYCYFQYINFFIDMQCNGKAPIPGKCALFGIGFILCRCVSSCSSLSSDQRGEGVRHIERSITIKQHLETIIAFISLVQYSKNNQMRA